MNALSRRLLSERTDNERAILPDQNVFDLPEKVLQFGTGVLLRALPDYFIDKANRAGVFNGRIVAVKSTDAGDPSIFAEQDNLYTLCVRGVAHGREVTENTVCAAISRVLPAKTRWNDVLACAANPDLAAIVSNTTEVGLRLVREDLRKSPPDSFPGKLLAFLFARFRAFRGDPHKGLVIVPTELLPDNGVRLKEILLDLARHNGLEPGFLQWFDQHCRCCNSLVDRIVPGKPAPEKTAGLWQELGYTDQLLAVAEPYCLWAVEGDERVREALPFHRANPDAMVIAPDIRKYIELKLRLLNGTHTLSCGLAFLCGIFTVGEAMRDRDMQAFIECLMLREIAPAIPHPLPEDEAERFGMQVLDRFRNPFTEHRWLGITLQYTSKMRARCVPVLLEHYRKHAEAPEYMALGFAAYLRFMKSEKEENGRFSGIFDGAEYPIDDDAAAALSRKWRAGHPPDVVRSALSDTEIWGTDLGKLPGFAGQVSLFLSEIMKHGAKTALQHCHKTVQT